MKQLDKDLYMLSASKTAVLFGSDKQSLSTPKTQATPISMPLGVTATYIHKSSLKNSTKRALLLADSRCSSPLITVWASASTKM